MDEVVMSKSEMDILDYWKMKNMDFSKYNSSCGVSAWAEWDSITDSSDDDMV